MILVNDSKAMDLSSHLEDYLEAIANLERDSRVARSRDIAQRLGVTKASVTAALRALSERGLINYQPYSHITLTDQGQALAREVIHRHDTITRFFHEVLGMERAAAESNACRVEHAVDDEVMRRLATLLETLATCPRCGAQGPPAPPAPPAAGDADAPRTCRACQDSPGTPSERGADPLARRPPGGV